MSTNSKIKVVLVEDDAEYRAFLAQEIALKNSAEIIFQTGSESEAREWLRANDDWNVCVVDIFIKGGSGIALLSILRKRKTNQKVYVLSNYLSPLNKKLSNNLNATKVFDKLTDMEALIQSCSNI